MTFSKAMKKIQPLEVTPMLGSAPSSPTLLNTKLRFSGWYRSSERLSPSGPVMKTPSGRVGSGGGGGGASFVKQPASDADSINIPTSKALTRMKHRQSDRAITLSSIYGAFTIKVLIGY
jgi:hypothetical protein